MLKEPAACTGWLIDGIAEARVSLHIAARARARASARGMARISLELVLAV